MKKIIRAYYYLFYKLYKWIGKENGWADWKAVLAIEALLIFFLLSIVVYYTTLVDHSFRLGDNKVLIINFIILITIPNYFIFHHKDQWKGIIKEFDKLPDRKNNIGGAIVFAVLLFIIGNLIFSFYLMSQVDWAQYR